MRWDQPAEHPRWLRSADFDALSQARSAPCPDPDAVTDRADGLIAPHRKLFARKFSTSVDAQVLERIDCELRR